ncbi:ABC transporter substrate-binding protein [Rhodococcus sp. AD45]|uniref:ABC transporter substrate-binding protein n=2 Tax=unclassified Rhodococcus (in: high G+C Gram-positive bacteria) TaxID=192944 RepID=UPI001EF9DD78|nr:ABC transporter substrate-binding protein [Rhodococcus sp. AD45]
MAAYSNVTSLDPAKIPALGSTGGNEMAAIYDVLMRYETTSGTFVPHLAKSLTVSSDRLQWILQLRDGVTFSDGNDVSASEVMWSIDRYTSANGLGSQLWKSNVSSAEVSGSHSITFTMKQPWTEFPATLASGYGMVVSASSVAGEQFTPVGAGPFTIDQFRPNEELRLTSRSDYWDGKPYLDALRFVGLTGDTEKLEALNVNDVQVAFIRSAEAVERARAEGHAGYVETMPLASVAMINNRPGRPGADVRVRQAIAHAINLDTFNERVDKGAGLPGSSIFPEWSPLHGEVSGLEYNPEAAKRLLDEAKSDGYDGHLSFLGIAAAKSQTTALAVQSMLQAVGFTVTLELENSAGDVTKRINVAHDYDISYSGISLPAAAPVNKLTSALNSTSNNNYLGYSNPRMDALLSQLQTTDADSDARRELLEELQGLVNETVPFVTLGAAPTFTLWAAGVHGIEPSMDSIMLFGKAWLSA